MGTREFNAGWVLGSYADFSIPTLLLVSLSLLLNTLSLFYYNVPH